MKTFAALLLTLLLPFPTFAACAFGAGLASNNVVTATSDTVSQTLTGSNITDVVFALTTNSGAITSMTYAGNAMTQIGPEKSTGTFFVTTWYLTGAPAGTANIVMNVASSQTIALTAAYWTGAGTPDSATSGTGNATTITATVTPVGSSECVVTAARYEQRNIIAGANTNNRTGATDTGSNIFDSTSNPVSTATTMNMATSDGSSQAYAWIGFAIPAFSAASTATSIAGLTSAYWW